MRVLFLPLIGAVSQMDSESCFVNFRNLWRTAHTRWPHFYGHLAVPFDQVDPVAAELTAEERQYLEVIPEDGLPGAFHTQECGFGTSLLGRFNRHTGWTWIDMVMTARTVIGHPLQVALRDWRGHGGCPTIALWEPGIDQDFFAQKAIADPVRRAKAISMATCPTQFLSVRERDLAIAWARKFLSPTLVYAVMERGEVIQPTVKTIADDPTTAPARHRLYFSGRLNATKRIKFIADLYAHVFALGYPVTIKITSPSKIKPVVRKQILSLGKGRDGEPLISLVGPCPLEEFKAARKAATIVLLASSYEGYPFGFLQLATSGALTIFPHEEWTWGMVPRDYPWVYKTEVQALAFIKQALRGEWPAMVRQQLAALRRLHAPTSLSYDDRRWDWWTDPRWYPQHETRVPAATSGIGKLVMAYAATHERFTMAEICAYLEDEADALTPSHWVAPPPRYWSRSWVHRLLTERFGFLDGCIGPEPEYWSTPYQLKRRNHGETQREDSAIRAAGAA